MDSVLGKHQCVRPITLSLTAKYAATWGTWEGIRELVQNWHDGVLETRETLNLPTWTNVGFRKLPRANFLLDEYEAFYNTGTNSEEVLGSLTYDAVHHRLTLVNKSTALHKKILLLGYSRKAETRKVIGQFGEGLKIGALALVREGRIVTMETSNDRWQFDLAEDETFGEKVLTVFVTARSADIDILEGTSDEREEVVGCEDTQEAVAGPEDTTTRVSLESDLWGIYKQRFLFLCPPEESVSTDQGALLLDPPHKGHLYVKGVWVSDLRDEGLATGVNFAQLQLDRDRNAVPRPSEIDHIVSCMWIRALEKRPELSAQYYQLLQQNDSRDVRHAVDYANQKMAKLVAEQFTLEHGENVFAVSHLATQQELDQIQTKLKKNFILCNNTLLEILFKSGLHIPLDQALANQRAATSLVRPYHMLVDEEQAVIQHASALVQEVDKKFSAGMVDVVDTREIKTCTLSGTRVLVPYWMVSRELTHKNGPLCPPPHEAKCMCREARLCTAILGLRGIRQTQLDDALPQDLDHALLCVVQPLALQACNLAQPFCQRLHKDASQNWLDPGQASGPQMEHKFCLEREAAFLQELSQLRIEHQRSKQDQSAQIEEVNSRLQRAEQELICRERSLVDSEQKLEDECKRRVSKAQEIALAKVKKLEDLNKCLDSDNATLKQELQYSQETIAKLRAEVAQWEPSVERKTAGLMEELLHYVQQCRKRTESLQIVCKKQLEQETAGDSRDKYQLLYNLSCILTEDLQDTKILCLVCTRKRKEVLLSPCGHYQLCSDCVAQMKGQCPTCREPIVAVCKVYE